MTPILAEYPAWREALEAAGFTLTVRGVVGARWGVDLVGELAGAPARGHLAVTPEGVERADQVEHFEHHFELRIELPEKLNGQVSAQGRGGAEPPLQRSPLLGRFWDPPYLDLRHLLPGYLCRGAPPERQAAVLGSPPVCKALQALGQGQLSLSRDQLVLRAHGRELDQPARLLEPLGPLVQALRVAALSPWRAAAARTGLEVQVDEDREPVLEGEGAGLPLRVSRVGDEELLVVVTLATALPWALRISAPSQRHPVGHALKPVDVPNPVLRSYVRAWSLKPEAGRVFMAQQGLTGPLMAVLHGHPGSEVLSDRVVLRRPMDWPDALEIKRAVDEALELGEALEQASRATREALRR